MLIETPNSLWKMTKSATDTNLAYGEMKQRFPALSSRNRNTETLEKCAVLEPESEPSSWIGIEKTGIVNLWDEIMKNEWNKCKNMRMNR